MDGGYIIPEQTRIGHVHLKVANLERSLGFYRDLLGFELTTIWKSGCVYFSRRLPSSYWLEHMA